MAANIQANFANLVGPRLMGIAISSFLSGIVGVQTYDYCRLYLRKDQPWLIALVAFTFAITFAELVTNIMIIYAELLPTFVVQNYAGTLEFPSANWVPTFLSPFLAVSVQAFFAHRAYVVQTHWSLLVVMGLGITFSGGAGLSVSIFSKTILQPGHLAALKLWIQIWVWETAIVDIFISVVFVLRMVKLQSPYSNTQNVVLGLIYLALQTASFTAVVAVSCAIAAHWKTPSTNWQVMLNIFLPRTYMISMMTVLNSRKKMSLATSAGTEKPTLRQKILRNGGGVQVQLDTFVVEDVGPAEVARGRERRS